MEKVVQLEMTDMLKPEREVIKVIDHGYVQLIECWGRDESIIEAARMSTSSKGFKGWGPNCKKCHQPIADTHIHVINACGTVEPEPGDEKLLKYLWDNHYETPFEMAGMVIEVKAPIFVFLEWHRHRTQSLNEMSAQYIQMPDENYAAPTGNRQAQGAAEPADELARLVVPVARYSRMRASANLRNWLTFLTLHMAPAAQWEIRQYANAVGELVADRFPRTWELFSKESA